MSVQPISVETKLKRIRDAFMKQVPSQVEGVRKAFESLDRNAPWSEQLEDLHRRIHTLKGACASFSLSSLTAVAAPPELLVKEAILTKIFPEAEWFQKMREHLSKIEYEAARIETIQRANFNETSFVAASASAKGKEKKTIYLCEDDSFQRMNLAAQIGCFGFEVISFGNLEQMRQATRNSPPDAIVMDVVFPNRPLGGTEVISALSMDGPVIPTVFISSQSDLQHRLSAVRAGSSAYFVKPVNISNLCATLSSLTSDQQPDPYRVMIVDDDPYLAELYSTILQGAGMVTLTVNDPLQALAPLYEFRPDLIISDMYMPGCSGMEFAKAIRQIEEYFCIPIVYLSSETDTDRQFHALRMGGDEFLTKPIKPEHLISTVAVRAERMKIIRSNMVRDSMTGLFNNTSIKEHANIAIDKARREGHELCFALLNLDGFKHVADTYGHTAGDKVLITLSRLLQQLLQGKALIGRSGSEEFSVILSNCNIATAVSLLNLIRQSFSAIQFPFGNETISLTFSCGVAPFSSYGNAALLNKAADDALSKAKNEGCNRVVVACGP